MMSMKRNSQDGAQLSPQPQQIEMYPSGKYVDLLNPDPGTIEIQDIAHHLSLICRYTGGVRRFYSVAEHCCLVTELVKHIESTWSLADKQRSALLHDGSEAYLNDLTAPAKYAIRQMDYVQETGVIPEDVSGITSPYDELSDIMETVLCEKFGFMMTLPAVRIADLWAMRIEAEQLTVSKGVNWRWPHEMPNNGELPDGVLFFGGLSPELAEQMFLKKYQELFALAIG